MVAVAPELHRSSSLYICEGDIASHGLGVGLDQTELQVLEELGRQAGAGLGAWRPRPRPLPPPVPPHAAVVSSPTGGGVDLSHLRLCLRPAVHVARLPLVVAVLKTTGSSSTHGSRGALLSPMASPGSWLLLLLLLLLLLPLFLNGLPLLIRFDELVATLPERNESQT